MARLVMNAMLASGGYPNTLPPAAPLGAPTYFFPSSAFS
jgi:hypothetical protein